MTKKITNIIIIATLVIWLGWSIFVGTATPAGDEISRVILDFAADHMPVVAIVFYLMGHWFWPQKVKYGKMLASDKWIEFPPTQSSMNSESLTKHTCVDCGTVTADPWKVGSRQPLCKGCFFDLDGKGQQ